MAQRTTTRRLAAIFIADVVGYSRLVEADEAGALAAVKGHLTDLIEPSIAEHRGRVVKTMGDGILAEFASAVDAVSCARAIQEAMPARNAHLPENRRMRFRIGVNVGDIVVDGDDIHGDGVNVAARLESIAEPGGICISGTVYDHVHGKLDASFADLGEQAVKNIDRRVRVYQVLPPGTERPGSVRRRRATLGGWRMPAIAAAAVLVVAGLAVWNFPFREPATEAARLSIVVLPFDNLSGDPEQAYFADAITEDLITDLSRIRGAFVIARGTTFTYKGKAANAKDVAKELNVRYVLEGSVRRSGVQVRVNAQLIDGETGAHIWSEKFDREIKDVIALQSDITGHIASVLRAELLEAESLRPKPANFEAWDYAVQGLVTTHRVRLDAKAYLVAKELFERAIGLDPDLALAWEGLSFVHFSAATREIPGVSVPNSIDLALAAAQKAVSLDPRSSNAYRVLGMAFYWKGQGENALAACQKALDLNRNNDLAIICVSRATYILGKLDESIRLVKKAQQLNPRFRVWLKYLYIGTGLFYLGKYQEAVVALGRAAADYPKHASIKLYLASSLSMLGRVDEARVVLAAYTKLARGKRNTIEKLRADRGHIVPDFERLAKALRRAGMAESDADNPPKMSIVVLPFENLSGDPEQAYFADAITEDLITDLSRIRGAFVIARGTSFTYKGKAANAKTVAKELNVRYVLEGSARRAGEQVRVNAQLIDGETGGHIWSERFDREFKNVFALQSDITGRIAAVLRVELLEAESRHSRPANLEAWDYALRGQVTLHRVTSGPTVFLEAKALFEKALKLDPDMALAWEGLAFIHFAAATREIPGVSVPHSKNLALEAGQKAVSLDPRSSGAHVVLGLAFYWNGLPERALASCETALDLNRNNEHAYLCVGQVKRVLGKPAEAIPIFEKAQKLNPRYRAWLRHMYIGSSRIALGEFDEAVIVLKKARAGFAKHASVNLHLATALALAGRLDEARVVLAEYMQLARGKRDTIEKLRADRGHIFPDFERRAEALRRAGMPETDVGKPPKMSIVVLPFENLSGDPEQAYFADAITEDLITDLSRIRGAFVIARGTSFTYKGKAANAKDVAKELNVRYVLEGSARRAGDQVRINAQLIDGETGGHIWSERFDREFKNVFALQSDITGRIAAVLRVELLEAESRHSRPANLEAWDYALRGQVTLHRVTSGPTVFLEAKEFFEKALALDPGLGLAWEGLAFVHYVAATRELPGITAPNSKQLLLDAAQKAVSLDPRSSGAHTVLGLAHLWQRQPDRALASCDTALDLNRNNDDAYICAALAKRALGDPAACVRLFEISRRLNPRFRAWRRNLLMGNCRLLLGEYDKAVIDLNKAKAEFPTHQNVNLYLASALALHGRLAEARDTLATYASLPNAKWNTIESVRANLGHLSPDWDRVLEGLRRAGMPER